MAIRGIKRATAEKYNVQEINKIPKKYKALRQKSKTPTFALTYQGTYITLMQQGMPQDEALALEKSFNELYKVSVQWVEDRLKRAEETGFITVAFGLRVRAPALQKSFMGAEATPRTVAETRRTLGNAMGQSYGLLNNRSTNEFMERVWAAGMQYDILPTIQVHDSSYYLVANNQKAIDFINKHLPECMAWQELEELKHDTVKLSGAVSIFHPDWSNEIELTPSDPDISPTIQKAKEKYVQLESGETCPIKARKWERSYYVNPL